MNIPIPKPTHVCLTGEPSPDEARSIEELLRSEELRRGKPLSQCGGYLLLELADCEKCAVPHPRTAMVFLSTGLTAIYGAPLEELQKQAHRLIPQGRVGKRGTLQIPTK
jgi:hypothetical protein